MTPIPRKQRQEGRAYQDREEREYQAEKERNRKLKERQNSHETATPARACSGTRIRDSKIISQSRSFEKVSNDLTMPLGFS
jgi:hypothetical protein